MAKITDIDITSLLWQEGSAPSTPASTKWRLYFKTNGLFMKDDAGVETGPFAATVSSPSTHSVKIYNDGAQSITNNTSTAVNMANEEWDSDGYHFTSTANLTGTVAKTASSAALVGSSTLFTSELTVGQIISVPGTAAEKRVVTVITDNTHLTVGQAFANSASGQTAARTNAGIAVPSAALAGKYLFQYKAGFANVNTTGIRLAFLRKNTVGDDTTNIIGSRMNMSYISATLGADQLGSAIVDLAFGDFVELYVYQNSGGSLNSGTTLASGRADVNTLSAVFLG